MVVNREANCPLERHILVVPIHLWSVVFWVVLVHDFSVVFMLNSSL